VKSGRLLVVIIIRCWLGSEPGGTGPLVHFEPMDLSQKPIRRKPLYTLINSTPSFVFGILTLLSSIYFTILLFGKKHSGYLSIKITLLVGTYSLSVVCFLIGKVDTIGWVILKYITLPSLIYLIIAGAIFNLKNSK
jgi:hypothetical protein